MIIRPLSLLLASLAHPALAPAAAAQCSGVAFDHADFALDTDGERLVLRPGPVQVYQRTASVPAAGFPGAPQAAGPPGWTLLAEFRPDIGQFGFGYGRSVALFGNTLVVGSIFEPLGALNSVGTTYVYSLGGAAPVQRLRPSDGADGDLFGAQVAFDGSTLIVANNLGFGTASAVYVFERQGGDWVEVQKFQASAGQPDDLYGSALAVAGDRFVVGARLADHVDVNSGVVYVYERVAGVWQESQQLVAAETDRHQQFGTSVALDGTRLLIGAPIQDNGRAHLFELQGGLFVESRQLIPPDPRRFYKFGRAVALAAGRAAVGAEQRVYVFDEAWDWNVVRRHYGGNSFGERLAIGGDVVAVGDFNSSGQAPEAYLFPTDALISPSCYCDGAMACADPDAGCRGSARRGVALAACGSTSVSRDDLVLSVDHLPNSGSSMVCFLMGTLGSGPAFGNGRRCLAPGSVFAFAPGQSNQGEPVFSGPGLVGYSVANLPPGAHILAGETRTFQAVYTDLDNPPRCPGGLQQTDFTGRNSTQALSVTFVP